MEFLTLEDIKKELGEVEFFLSKGDDENHISASLLKNLEKYKDIEHIKKDIKIDNVINRKDLEILNNIVEDEDI